MQNLRYTVSLFCVLLPILGVILGTWLQQGFSHNDFLLYILLFGNTLFVLFSPSLLIIHLPNVSQLYSLVSGLMLLLLACLGYLVRYTGWELAPILSGLGYLVFAFSSIKFLRVGNILKFAGVSLVGVYLFSWVVSTVWGRFSLSPIFAESISALSSVDLSYVQDTLYHASFAQTIRTFDISSTGLDGMPFIQYHIGGHWLFGQLSNYLQISTMDCFNFGYLVLILPVFFQAFLNFGIDCAFQRGVRPQIEIVFFLLLLMVFMGMPKGLYSQGQLGISALVNESMVISMATWFMLLSLLLYLFKTKKMEWGTAVLLIPFLVFVIARTKISTGFITYCGIAFLFLRHRLWRLPNVVICVILCTVSFLVAYFLSVETIVGAGKVTEEGGFQWFHFYRSTHDFRPFDWFVLFFIWSYLVWILEYVNRHQIQCGFKFSEVVFLTVFVGILPGLVMTFSGGNSVYFSALQLFLSGAIILGYSDILQQNLKQLFSFWRWPWMNRLTAMVLVIGVFAYTWMDVRECFREMVRKNVIVRGKLLSPVKQEIGNVELFDSRVTSQNSNALGQALRNNQLFQFILAVKQLENLPFATRIHSAVFVDPSMPRVPSNLNCVAYTFLLPAYSGLPLIFGINRECSLGVYGEAFYQEAMIRKNESDLLAEAKLKAKQLGFSQLQVYNRINNKFYSISL